jgi:chromosome segregation ATPase
MKAKNSILPIAIVLLTMCGYALADSGTKMYRWVDKDGVVHYGSVIPPEYAQQQSQTLNAQGQVVQTQQAEKTPAQLAAEAKAKQDAELKAQADTAAKARDKVLLDTYSSTADITRDRDSKLAAIDTQINVLSGSIANLQTTLAEYQSRASELTGSNKPVPANLQKQIDTTRQQLVANQQNLLAQQQHKKQVSDQFAADMARYQQLTAP